MYTCCHCSIIHHYFQVADLIRIHNNICNEHAQDQPIIQLSLDGVLESKSSLNSLDTYSVKFSNCRNIYPLSIVKPCNKFKYDDQNHFKNILDDINTNNVIIESCIFDKPKRSRMKCTKCHAAKFPCEYCYNSAVVHVHKNEKNLNSIRKRYATQESNLSQQLTQISQSQTQQREEEHLREELETLQQDKQNELEKCGRKKLTWPSSTMQGNLRTLEDVRTIVEEITRNPNILKSDPDFCKGIKGKSLLLDQPHFHYVNDVPCEYMHSSCLGVIKRVVELTFKVGENRERVTKRRLSDPQSYNEQIKEIQVFRECSRRCRNLDFGVMKAAEFRNITIFFFPIILNCIEDEFLEEKQLWLHLVYMIRSCIIPNNEFTQINQNDVESACQKFYDLYEKTYGVQNCTYSTHVVPSHLLQIRGDMPLTHRSAFKFENFFAEMRNLFKPGTVSPMKQIMQNCFMKRILEHHKCEKSTYFCAEKKPKPGVKFNPPKENNSLIYVYSENHKLDMYSIKEVIDEDTFSCQIQGKFNANIPLAIEYDWSKVGVFKVGPLSQECKIIKRKDISGKVMIVKNYLITCPLNVLHEQ